MKRILLDTNVILYIALGRIPFIKDSEKVFLLLDQTTLKGYISASSVTDIYYITRKSKGTN